MAVVIQQVDHVPAAGATRPRGLGGDDRGSEAVSPAALQSQVMQLLRREAGRRARLWAD